MKKAALLFTGILAGASVTMAATHILSLTGTSALTVDPNSRAGGMQISKIETRFFDGDIYGDHPSMYKVVTKSSYDTGVDGLDQTSIIEAYQTKHSALDTKAWTLKVAGGDFKTFGDSFVYVTTEGCCDSPDINHMINVKTGKELIQTWNSSTVEFTVPNSKLPSRYLAQINDEKAPMKRGNRAYMGTIGYFDADHIRGYARIYADIQSGWGADLGEMTTLLNAKDQTQETTVTLWSSDGSNDPKAAFTGIGFSGSMMYNDPNQNETFSVYVDGDQLDAAHSKVSSGLDIEIVNL